MQQVSRSASSTGNSAGIYKLMELSVSRAKDGGSSGMNSIDMRVREGFSREDHTMPMVPTRVLLRIEHSRLKKQQVQMPRGKQSAYSRNREGSEDAGPR